MCTGSAPICSAPCNAISLPLIPNYHHHHHHQPVMLGSHHQPLMQEAGLWCRWLVFVTDFRRSPNKRRKATWVYKLFVFSIAQFIRVVIVS